MTLTGHTGTETVVRDLALGLQATGHQPMVYAPTLGAIAQEIAAAGVPVVSRFELLPYEPDVIHGHHHVETVQALLQFPRARGIFVCHDRLSPNDIPPRLPRLLRYVAVDENCRERLAEEYQIPPQLIRVIYNWVDVHKFHPRPPLPPTPQRALVFSNYAGPDSHLTAVQEACAAARLPLDVIGAGSGQSCPEPERRLGQYDLVFAKARCALEAMAVGAAVILCDARGLGPLVTAATVAQLRPWNFGMRLLRDPLEPPRILQEINRYNATDAFAVSCYIRKHADFSLSLAHYLGLYQEVLEAPLPDETCLSQEIADYMNLTLARISALERELEPLKQPYRMEPMSEFSCNQLSLAIRAAPAQTKVASSFFVQVELDNQSPELLQSFPPCPMHFTYSWFSLDGAPILRENPRTVFRPPLPSGEKGTYWIQVSAPVNPSHYQLRITLVQEFVRWLDELAVPVLAETSVVVD